MRVEPIPVWKKKQILDEALIDAELEPFISKFRWAFSRPGLHNYKDNPIRTLLRGYHDPEPGRVVYLHQLVYILSTQPVRASEGMRVFFEDHISSPLVLLIQQSPNITHRDKDKRNNVRSNLWPPIPDTPSVTTPMSLEGYHPAQLAIDIEKFNKRKLEEEIRDKKKAVDALFASLRDDLE